jgi:hypothetical protein
MSASRLKGLVLLAFSLAICLALVRSTEADPPALPVIKSILPADSKGMPQLQPDKTITILGTYFSPTKGNNKIGVRTYVRGNPKIPPTRDDLKGEIKVTAATPDGKQLQGLVPDNLQPGKYLLWVYVEGAGDSNAKVVTVIPPEVLVDRIIVPPVISDVQPKEPDGYPYATEGKKLIIQGQHFGTDPSKVLIGVRTFVADKPQIPPQPADLLAAIKVTSASPNRLEAMTPGGITKTPNTAVKCLVWVEVAGVGASNPVAVYFNSKYTPPPPAMLITKVDDAYPGAPAVVHGNDFKPDNYLVSWYSGAGLFQRTPAHYLNPKAIQTQVPIRVSAGPYQVWVESNAGFSNTVNATILSPKPLNLYATEADDNGLPKNPKFGWQLVHDYGDPKGYYPKLGVPTVLYDPLNLVWSFTNPPDALAPVTSIYSIIIKGIAGVTRDYSKATDQIGGSCTGWWNCGPHENWFPVTYEGYLYWDKRSNKGDITQDDDYNFWLYTLDGGGVTIEGNKPGGITVEFSSSETIDQYRTQWWNKFHDDVDYHDDWAHGEVDGCFAIMTALFGMDNGHIDNGSELHPVYTLALRPRQPASDTDLWAFFVRDWGDEGYCGTTTWYLTGLPQKRPGVHTYTFRLPWRNGATSVEVVDSDIQNYLDSKNNNPNYQWYFDYKPGVGVFLTFELPEPGPQHGWNGMVKLHWKGQPEDIAGYEANFHTGPNSFSPQLMQPKVSEEALIVSGIRNSLPADKRAVFEQELERALTPEKPATPEISGRVPMAKERYHPAPVAAAHLHARPRLVAVPDADAQRRAQQLQDVLQKHGITLHVVPQTKEPPLAHGTAPLKAHQLSVSIRVPTGGYTVAIKEVRQVGKELWAGVDVKAPKPDGRVTQTLVTHNAEATVHAPDLPVKYLVFVLPPVSKGERKGITIPAGQKEVIVFADQDEKARGAFDESKEKYPVEKAGK